MGKITRQVRLFRAGQNPTAYESGDKHVYFKYDCMGRRIRKRVETYNGSSWPETSDELFVYDGWNIVMVINANASDVNATAAITRKYTWGLDLSGTIHGAAGIGGLLAAFIPGGEPDDVRLWYFYDGNGNVGQVLDATSLQSIGVTAKYEYDPYGNLVYSSVGGNGTGNPFQFSTKWFDAETGLGYWGHRYYSPRLGRWLSRDPIAEKGGLNLLGALANCPVNYIDGLADAITYVNRNITLVAGVGLTASGGPSLVQDQDATKPRPCGKKVEGAASVPVRMVLMYDQVPVEEGSWFDTGRRPTLPETIVRGDNFRFEWGCERKSFFLVPYCDFIEKGKPPGYSAIGTGPGNLSFGFEVKFGDWERRRPHCRTITIGWAAWYNNGLVDAGVGGQLLGRKVTAGGLEFLIPEITFAGHTGNNTYNFAEITMCCEECKSGCCKPTIEGFTSDYVRSPAD